MKTLEELRRLFVSARNMAKEASPTTVDEAIVCLKAISDHAKELYRESEIYLERAKCRNLYESIDNVILTMKSYGYCHDTVAAFFGLNKSKAGSFSDISSGRGTIKAPKIPPAPQPPVQGQKPEDGGAVNGVPFADDDHTETETQPKPKVKLDLPPLNLPDAPDATGNAPAESADVIEVGANGEKTTDDKGADDKATDDKATDDKVVDGDAPVVNGGWDDLESTAPAPADAVEGSVANGESPSGDVSSSDEPDPTGVIPVERGNELEPKSLSEFIGQKHIVNRLMEDITAAKMLGKKHLDNILLFGNRGLGKSTLMELIAKEMDVDFELIDCTAFANNHKSEENFHSFFLNIIEKDRPVVIAFDEIHALTPKMQSKLLVLLQKRVYSYMASGKTHNVPINDFTFVAATTDSDAVLQTIKDRCSNLRFTMVDYTRDELTQIFCNKLDAMGLKPADDEVVSRCVNRFRGSLRDINAIVKGIYTKAVVSKTDVVTVSLAESYFSERGLDAIGLDTKELEILRAIQAETRGSISEETLAARVYLDPKVLTKEYEPYLMKIGFISVNSKGRSLTPKAEDYLKYGYYDFGNGIYIGTNPYEEKAKPETNGENG